MTVRINDVEIKDKSRMQIVINKEDGYINGRAKDRKDVNDLVVRIWKDVRDPTNIFNNRQRDKDLAKRGL